MSVFGAYIVSVAAWLLSWLFGSFSLQAIKMLSQSDTWIWA
jgi:hypothetical protein